jgi:hypothetical protein
MTGVPPHSRDVDLDREIDALLAIEPSPQLVARVRANLAEPTRPASWRLPAIALAGGAIVAWLIVTLAQPLAGPHVSDNLAGQDTMRPQASSVPASVGDASPSSGVAVSSTRASRTRRQAYSRRQASPSEVLIPRAEQNALQHVLRVSAQEPLRVSPDSAVVVRTPTDPPSPIVVPAIVIEPLVPQRVEKGESR